MYMQLIREIGDYKVYGSTEQGETTIEILQGSEAAFKVAALSTFEETGLADAADHLLEFVLHVFRLSKLMTHSKHDGFATQEDDNGIMTACIDKDGKTYHFKEIDGSGYYKADFGLSVDEWERLYVSLFE